MSKIHDAAATGDLKTIEEILTTNPNSIKEPESVTMNGALPIVCAAIRGQLEAFKLLFKNGFPTPTDAIDNGKSGMTLIHFACSGGCVEIVKLLLKSGFSLDIKTVNGMTVMHSAASGGSKEMMMFLNEKGFSYEVQAKGWTPLQIAAKCDQVEVVKFLVHEVKISHKYLLNNRGKIFPWCGEKVKKFLQDQALAEASPIMPNELHVAAEQNAVGEIEKIIKANSESIKQPDSERQMLPIAWAAYRGHLEAFKLLLDNSSPVDEVDFKEKIPLIHFACSGGNIEIVKLLLGLGYTLDVKIATGHTGMHAAAYKGHNTMMEFLNKNGIPYNVQTNNGATPMNNAAKGDRVDTMKFLHQQGLPYEELLITQDGKTSWIGGEKVQKFFQEQALAKTSPNLQQKDKTVTPASKPTPAVAAKVPSLTIPNATPRSIPSTTAELSLGAKPVGVPQKSSDLFLSSLHERLDKLRSERVTPPVNKPTPPPQKPLSQNLRLSSFPQRIDALRSNQTATLAERVAMLEAEKQNQQSIITRQQQEIGALKAEFKELKALLAPQTSIVPSASNPPKPWTPTFHHPISSTSPSVPDVEFLGSNSEASDLRALSVASSIKSSIKTEPKETDDSHSGKKHLLESAETSETSAAKRQR